MKRRIKQLELHITTLGGMLLSAHGKQKQKIAEEIVNEQFELAQLKAKSVIPPVALILLLDEMLLRHADTAQTHAATGRVK